jgi:hypothetical protein
MPKGDKKKKYETEQIDLPTEIQKISQAMTTLTSGGLTRKAVVVLIKEETKLPKKAIERVLTSLGTLGIKYTVPKAHV